MVNTLLRQQHLLTNNTPVQFSTINPLSGQDEHECDHSNLEGLRTQIIVSQVFQITHTNTNLVLYAVLEEHHCLVDQSMRSQLSAEVWFETFLSQITSAVEKHVLVMSVNKGLKCSQHAMHVLVEREGGAGITGMADLSHEASAGARYNQVK